MEQGAVQEKQAVFGIANQGFRDDTITMDNDLHVELLPFDQFPDDPTNLPAFDVPIERAWADAFDALKPAFAEIVQAQLPGDDYRHLHVDGHAQTVVVQKIYIPYVFGSYDYKGTTYQFQMDGRSPDTILFTDRPQCDVRQETLASFGSVRETFGCAFWSYLIGGGLFSFLAVWFGWFGILKYVSSALVAAAPVFVLWIIVAIIMHIKKTAFAKERHLYQESIKEAMERQGESPNEQLLEKHESWMKKLEETQRRNRRLKTVARALSILAYVAAFLFLTVSGIYEWSIAPPPPFVGSPGDTVENRNVTFTLTQIQLAGNERVIVHFTIVNNRSGMFHVYGGNWLAYVDGVVAQRTFIQGNISPGMSLKDSLTITVPSEWQEITLQYDATSFGPPFTYIITPQNVVE